MIAIAGSCDMLGYLIAHAEDDVVEDGRQNSKVGSEYPNRGDSQTQKMFVSGACGADETQTVLSH